MINEYIKLEIDDTPVEPNNYGLKLLLLVILFILPLVVINAVRDPFFLFASQDAPPRKMDVRSEYFAKRRLLERIQPQTVIIGTSKAAHGIDANSRYLPQPALNYGLPGSAISMHKASFQHAINTVHPKQIFLLLDFPAFNANADMNQKTNATYKAQTRNMVLKDTLASHLLNDMSACVDKISALLSLRTLTESIGIEESRHVWPVMTPDGSWVENDAPISSPRFNFFFVLNEFVGKEISNKERPGFQFASSTSKDTLLEFTDLLDFAYQHPDTETFIALDPVYVMSQIAIYETGFWRQQEEWKRALVEINERLAKKYGKPAYAIWDFSNTTLYNVEPIPQRGSKMRWHLESVHFTPALGDVMIRRMTNQDIDDDMKNFGVILGSKNIEASLKINRCALASYMSNNPQEVKETKTVVDKYFTQPYYDKPLLQCDVE